MHRYELFLRNNDLLQWCFAVSRGTWFYDWSLLHSVDQMLKRRWTFRRFIQTYFLTYCINLNERIAKLLWLKLHKRPNYSSGRKWHEKVNPRYNTTQITRYCSLHCNYLATTHVDFVYQKTSIARPWGWCLEYINEFNIESACGYFGGIDRVITEPRRTIHPHPDTYPSVDHLVVDCSAYCLHSGNPLQ